VTAPSTSTSRGCVQSWTGPVRTHRSRPMRVWVTRCSFGTRRTPSSGTVSRVCNQPSPGCHRNRAPPFLPSGHDDLGGGAVRLSLVPRRQDFYGLFAELGENAHETAKLTLERFAAFPDSNIDHGKVKDLEHEGDRLTADLYQLMNTQYVTPFDREDMQNLARAIDDVVDHAERASDLLGLYRVEAP